MPDGVQPGQPQQIQLPLVVVGADDVPVLYGNFFVVQQSQDEVILNVGQVAPPVLLGTQEQQLQQAQQVGYVPAKVVARYDQAHLGR